LAPIIESDAVGPMQRSSSPAFCGSAADMLSGDVAHGDGGDVRRLIA
jgi:hypothetical protein